MNEITRRQEINCAETSESAKKLDDIYARGIEIFQPFGWDPKEFLRVCSEHYYDEFLTRENEEFGRECEIYSLDSYYDISGETYLREGPNCYAFAMKWPINPITGTKFSVRPLPGEFSHGDAAVQEFTDKFFTSTPQELKAIIQKGMEDDAKICGMSVKEVDKDYEPSDKEWLIALAVTDPSDMTYGEPADFHFYRKGESGAWYHKPGVTEVRNLDASGKLIYDPAQCNRGIYSAFLGYYAVKGELA